MGFFFFLIIVRKCYFMTPDEENIRLATNNFVYFRIIETHFNKYCQSTMEMIKIKFKNVF